MVPSKQGGDLCQVHAGEDDGDAQPLDDAERLAEDVGMYSSFPVEVTVGGSTIFVLNVDRFEKV